MPATRALGAGKADVSLKADSPPHPPEKQEARVFIDRQRGLHAEMAESSLTDVLKLVMVV